MLGVDRMDCLKTARVSDRGVPTPSGSEICPHRFAGSINGKLTLSGLSCMQFPGNFSALMVAKPKGGKNNARVTTHSLAASKKQVVDVTRNEDSFFDDFEARKVIVRLDKDGEPAPFKHGEYVSFSAMYFVCWRCFDPANPFEYAECMLFPPSKRDILTRSLGGSDGTHRIKNNTYLMIPVESVLFVNVNLAKRMGIAPLTDQLNLFPEYMDTYEDAILQPSPVTVPFPDSNRVLVPPRPTCQLTHEEIRRIPVVGKGIELRMSRVPDGGRGVFATRDFAPNELVTLYFGHRFGEAHRKHIQQNNRGTHVKPLQFKHEYLDGIKIALGGMHAGQLLNQGSFSYQNCDWVLIDVRPSSGERLLGIRAIRRIFPGEELYVSYGKKFWDELEMKDPKDPPRVIIPNS
jgi:hypothetical protein